MEVRTVCIIISKIGGMEMTKVGEQLLQPETSWRRFDDKDSNIKYIGNWKANNAESGLYNNTGSFSVSAGDKFLVNFTGTKIRLIGAANSMRSTSIDVFIDGVKMANFSQYGALKYALVDVDIQNLPHGEHFLECVNNSTGGYGGDYLLDAIDIDEKGELKNYNPNTDKTVNTDTNTNGLLRIIMSDSSEREYKLSRAEIESFVKWYNRTLNTGNTCYIFNDIVDNSKEYLSFDQIISFKVILN